MAKKLQVDLTNLLTSKDIVKVLDSAGVVTPIADDSNNLYTDENGKIYVL